MLLKPGAGTPGVHGATYIAGIRDVTVTGGAIVEIDANGQLGTTSMARVSSKLRREIQGALQAEILALQAEVAELRALLSELPATSRLGR